MKHSLLTAACSAALLLTGCNGASNAAQTGDSTASDAKPANGQPFVSTEVATFDEPWAMTFLPDGRLLVTEKEGKLKLLDIASKHVGEISGVPAGSATWCCIPSSPATAWST